MLEKMLAAQATIKAAELQAEATMWAAAIGGVAIVFGLLFSWRTALHLQRVARLAETRKNVYLDMVGAYSDMITGFHTLLLEFEKNWPNQIHAIMEFSKKVDVATFVCETETKEKIFEFLKSFENTFLYLQNEMTPLKELIDELNSLSNRHKEIISNFEEAAKALEKIKIENRDPQKIQNILDYVEEQMRDGSKYVPLIAQKEGEVKEKINSVYPFIKKLADDLNDRVLPITHLLREELGAKTNIKLDVKIHEEIKRN